MATELTEERNWQGFVFDRAITSGDFTTLCFHDVRSPGLERQVTMVKEEAKRMAIEVLRQP